MTKNIVIQALDMLGDEFDVEKLIERLLFIEKVDKGLKDINENRIYEYNEVKQMFADR